MDLATQLQYRLLVLEEDCKLISKCLDDGPQYNNLSLLERHLETYRKLCEQVKEAV